VGPQAASRLTTTSSAMMVNVLTFIRSFPP
jgi:hypothetical protein